MKFIQDYKEGDRVSDIYLCKHKQLATTKNGKPYETAVLQDKTGTIDAKIWDPNSMGIGDYDALDYIEVYGEVTSFQGANQINVKRLRRCQEGEYDPANYLPVSKKDIDQMMHELTKLIDSIENTYLKALLQSFFVEDEDFVKAFRNSSAAKTVHHGFVGGLLEHTLSVTKLCDYYCGAYPMLKRDLLLTAAMLHDIGKVKELSSFPENDYTDIGNLLGHIVMGCEMTGEKAARIDGFPIDLLNELKHCILAASRRAGIRFSEKACTDGSGCTELCWIIRMQSWKPLQSFWSLHPRQAGWDTTDCWKQMSEQQNCCDAG